MSASNHNIFSKNLYDHNFYTTEFYYQQVQQHYYARVMQLTNYSPNCNRQQLVDLGLSHPDLIRYLLSEPLFNYKFEKEDLELFLTIENSYAAEAIFCMRVLRKVMGLNEIKDCIFFYETHRKEININHLNADILRAILLSNESSKPSAIGLFATPASPDHVTEVKAASSVATQLDQEDALPNIDLKPEKTVLLKPRYYAYLEKTYPIAPSAGYGTFLEDIEAKHLARENEELETAIALSLQDQEDKQYVEEKQNAIEATSETMTLLAAIKVTNDHDIDPDEYDLDIDDAAAAVNAVESDDENEQRNSFRYR